MSKKYLVLLSIGLIAILAFVLLNTAITNAQGPDDCPNYPGGRGGMMGHHRGGMMGNDCFDGGMWNGHHGNDGFRGRGMMSENVWTPPDELVPTGALTLESATAIAEAYVGSFENDNLALHEVVEIDGRFYGAVMEVDSGRGAFEFMISPVRGYVMPNHTMWNLKYGEVSNYADELDGVEMTISAERAVELATEYLVSFDETLTVGTEPLAFYGYYSLPVLENETVVGVLGVNGYTGQVMLHHMYGGSRN